MKVSLRVAIGCGLGLAVGLASATETLTLNIMGRPVGEVVAEVARQTGLPLETDRTVAGVPVFVKVDHMPVRTFLERLQRITGSDWQERGTSVVLSRANRRNAERAREESEVKTWLATSVKDHIKQADKGAGWSEDAMNKRVEMLVAQRDKHERTNLTEFMYTPEESSLWQSVHLEAIKMIPAAKMLEARPASPIVFSTRPNALQVGLPSLSGSLVRASQAERELLQRLAKAGIRFYIPGMSHSTAAPPDRAPADKVIVRVARPLGSVYFEIHSFIVGQDGKVLNSRSLQFSRPPRSFRSGIPAPTGSATLSPHSIEFAKAYVDYASKASRRHEFSYQGVPLGAGAFDACTSPELKKKLLRPTLYEPLGFVVSEVLEALADQTSLSLMAVVPDSLLTTLSRWAHSGKVTFAQLWSTQSAVDFAKDEHGWIISPRSLVAAEEARFDRAELETLLKEPTSWKALARYAAVTTSFNDGARLDQVWLEFLSQQAMSLLERYRDDLTIFHYTPLTWPHLASGQTQMVPLTAMPAAIRGKVFTMALNDNRVMQLSSTAQPLQRLTEIAQVEPTERYVPGMEDQIAVSLRGSRQEALCAIETGMPGAVLGARQVGHRLGAPPGTRNRSSFTEYMIAEIETLQIGITVYQPGGSTRSLRIAAVTSPMVKYTLEQLPERIRAEVELGRRDVNGGQ